MVAAYLVLARAHQLEGNQEGASIAFRDAFDRNNQDPELARTYTAWLVQTAQGDRAVAVANRLTKNAPALLSGWKLYLDLCTRVRDAGCTPDAEAGLDAAHRLFGVDQRTGEPLPTGLFGRLTRK
jgi:Flp pilus assembly protein TadD